MQCVTLPRITELNPHLICVLCGGYYIDATSIIECLHAFCKSCIVNYLQTNKYCPICDVQVHKTEPLQNIRPDDILQNIVYKLVPNLYKKEMRNRRNFYLNVQPQKRPRNTEMIGEITNMSNFYALDDIINLSLEYIDTLNNNPFYSPVTVSKRYFKCQAIATVKNLRKMLVAKYSLPNSCKIRFFLDNSQLPEHFKLLDLAYISSWNRIGSIRLFYDILIIQQKIIKIELEPKKVEENSSLVPTSEEIPLTKSDEPKITNDPEVSNVSLVEEAPPATCAPNTSQETNLDEPKTLIDSTAKDICKVPDLVIMAPTSISSASVSSVSTITGPIMATGIGQSSTNDGSNGSNSMERFVSNVDTKENELIGPKVELGNVTVESELNSTQLIDISKLSNGIVSDSTTAVVKSTAALPTTIVSTKPVKSRKISKDVTILSKNKDTVCTTSSLKVQRSAPPIFTRNEPHLVIKTTTCTSKLMSRPWTTTSSAVVSPGVSNPPPDSKSKSKPIMYKTSNLSRFSSNVSNKMKPLYPPHIDISVDKMTSRTPVLKIDPNTLSPIMTVTSNETKTSPSASTSNGAPTSFSASTSSVSDYLKKVYPYAASKLHSSVNNSYSIDNVSSYIHPSLIAGSKHLPGLIPYPPISSADTLQPMREFVQRMCWYRSGELDGANESRTINMTKFSQLLGHPMYSQSLHPSTLNTNYRPPPSKRPKHEKPSGGATQKPIPPLIRRIMPTTRTVANNIVKGSNNTITNSKASSGRENSKNMDKNSHTSLSITRVTPSHKESKHNVHMCNIEGTNRCDQVSTGEDKSNAQNNDKNAKETIKNQFQINNR